MRIKGILPCLLLVVCLLQPVNVQAASNLLVDTSALLTTKESAQLSQRLSDTSRELEMDVVVLTVDSLDGKSAEDYADDYYDSHGYDPDGILLLVAMEERTYWITTSGSAIRAFRDSELAQISAVFEGDLSSGDYYSAFCAFVSQVSVYAHAEAETQPEGWMVILGCLGVGVVVAFIAVFVMKGQLRSVRAARMAEDYTVAGSFALTRHIDLFLYRNVTRREKPQNDDSGSHRSSSGRSHGGGGGSF